MKKESLSRKAFNVFKKWKKDKNKSKNNLPEYVINYNNLSKKQIKELLRERCFALMFKYEYGSKEYNLYKQYKNNNLENLTETDIKRLEKATRLCSPFFIFFHVLHNLH